MSNTALLKSFGQYSSERINVQNVTSESFVTVDNMLPNKAGITKATIPVPVKGKIPGYQNENILIGNIRPYLKKIWFSNKCGGCSPDVLVLKINSNHHAKFVYYALLQDDFFVHMMNGAKGTKMPRGDKRQILDFLIPNYTLSKQKKIATILSTLDVKIELNNRINAELEAMAKTLYDYWFVQFDFPDENGNPYKSSGGKMIYNSLLKKEIPEEWEFGTFSALVETNPQEKLLNGSLAPHIEMRAVPEIGSCIANITQKIVSSGTKFRNNDVLLARTTPCLENGKTALVQGLTDNIVGHGSTEFVVLRSKYREAEGLIYLTARNKDFRTYCISNMTGTSGRKRISGAQVGAYKMAVSPAKVVRQFARQTTNIFKKIGGLHQENQQLTQLRDWLLPMLMNGQITVQ